MLISLMICLHSKNIKIGILKDLKLIDLLKMITKYRIWRNKIVSKQGINKLKADEIFD